MGVVIVGGAAGARITYEILKMQGITVLGFLHNFVKLGDWKDIVPILFSNDRILHEPDVGYFVATGDNFLRQQITEKIIRETNKLPINVIHPTAVISEYAKLNNGNLIEANVVIRIGAEIGTGTIINAGAIVSHDCYIGDYAQIGPGASLAGRVTIQKYAFVGTGASIIPHVTIGNNSIIAAGATVIRNVREGTMVAGCPAKEKKCVKSLSSS